MREWERIQKQIEELDRERAGLDKRLAQIRERCRHEWHSVMRGRDRKGPVAVWKCALCGVRAKTRGDAPGLAGGST